jgi:hypothetical protein
MLKVENIINQADNKLHEHHHDRENTFRDSDFFKIILLSPNQEISEERAKWLTNTPSLKTSPTGTYRAPFQDTSIVVYSRWPNSNREVVQATVGIDALLIFVDNEDEWPAIQREVEEKFKFVSVRLIVTDYERVRRWERDLLFASSLPKSSNNQDVVNKLNELDK